MTIIHVLGVDPGTVSGWALIRAGNGKPELLYHGEAGGRKMRKGRNITTKSTGTAASEIISKCQARIEAPDEMGKSYEYDPIILAIEDQFIPAGSNQGEKNRHKAVSILETARHCGGWEYAAQMHGLDLNAETRNTWRVHPVTWRKQQWGKARWSTSDAKRHAIMMLQSMFGVRLPLKQHHTAEAAFIGLYVASEVLFRRRTK